MPSLCSAVVRSSSRLKSASATRNEEDTLHSNNALHRLISECALTCCVICSCSLACFKVHKEGPCSGIAGAPKQAVVAETASSAPQESSDASIAAPQISTLSISIPVTISQPTEEPGPRATGAKRQHSDLLVDEGELDLSQLSALSSNKDLVNLLSNKRLQTQLTAILSSENPEQALVSTMDATPEFSSFVQTMLHHLGVRDANGVSTL